MTVQALVVTFQSPLNKGAPDLAQQVSAWLAAHPGIIIKDTATFGFDSPYSAEVVRLRLAYETGHGAGSTYLAKYYKSTPTLSASDQFNAEMIAGAPFNPVFLVDLSEQKTRDIYIDPLLVIGVDTTASPLMNSGGAVAWIAQPIIDTNPGAQVTATIINALGQSIGSALVRNVGLGVWHVYERVIVVEDPVSGELLALAGCCQGVSPGVLPPITPSTTTPYPCPPFVPQTPPIFYPYPYITTSSTTGTGPPTTTTSSSSTTTHTGPPPPITTTSTSSSSSSSSTTTDTGTSTSTSSTSSSTTVTTTDTGTTTTDTGTTTTGTTTTDTGTTTTGTTTTGTTTTGTTTTGTTTTGTTTTGTTTTDTGTTTTGTTTTGTTTTGTTTTDTGTTTTDTGTTTTTTGTTTTGTTTTGTDTTTSSSSSDTGTTTTGSTTTALVYNTYLIYYFCGSGTWGPPTLSGMGSAVPFPWQLNGFDANLDCYYLCASLTTPTDVPASLLPCYACSSTTTSSSTTGTGTTTTHTTTTASSTGPSIYNLVEITWNCLPSGFGPQSLVGDSPVAFGWYLYSQSSAGCVYRWAGLGFPGLPPNDLLPCWGC